MNCENCGYEYQTNECVECGHVQDAPKSGYVFMQKLSVFFWSHFIGVLCGIIINLNGCKSPPVFYLLGAFVSLIALSSMLNKWRK